ncbi:MAG: hypothetical protein INH41_30870 [Myxococcaceae bacterium]|nr:hypothetical protein [Myxococcaceae bacterium]
MLALSSALEALEAQRWSEALTIARRTRRAHPTGALRPELTVIEIEALCGLKSLTEAQDVADAMPRADQTPLALERLRRSCVSSK